MTLVVMNSLNSVSCYQLCTNAPLLDSKSHGIGAKFFAVCRSERMGGGCVVFPHRDCNLFQTSVSCSFLESWGSVIVEVKIVTTASTQWNLKLHSA